MFIKFLKSHSLLFLWVGVALYLFSLVLPGFGGWTEHQTYNVQYGYQILKAGAAGILIGGFAWCANILFFFCLKYAFSKQYQEGLIFSILSFIIGLQSFYFHTYPNGADNVTIDHLHIGYYVWELSFISLTMYFYLKHKEFNSNSANSLINSEKAAKITATTVLGLFFAIATLAMIFATILYHMAFK